DKFSLAISIGNLGILYREKGDYDQALKILKESLKLREELGNIVYIGTCLNSIGSVYGDKGELNQALKYFEQSIAIWEELDNKNRLATALNNIASVYRQKGNLDQALESLEQSLKLRKKLNNIKDIARSLYNVGLVYWFKGDFSKALVYLEQALVLNEEIQNDIKTSDTLFYLVSVALDNNNLEIAQKHLARLQEIDTKRKDKIINRRSQLAEALVLKASPSIQDRVKAKTILKRLIEEEVGEHSLIVLALLNLCDISLGELETTPSQKGLGEVQNFVEKIHVIAQQQTSHWLLSAAYILKTRISFLDLRYQWSFAKAEELKTTLQQVQQIAQEKQLFVLLAQVHLLLAFFYHSKLIFDEAKSEVEKAQEIISDKNLLKEEQKLNTISQQIQASEAAYSQYLGVLAETFEQGEHKQSLAALEQEFISSVDDYLQMLKASLVTLDAN
ncbi:MAG: tetratricopeptide repeat protein, partial [Candidatus Hermodarchaeota archaeon]